MACTKYGCHVSSPCFGAWLWVGMLGLGGDFGTFMDWELKGYWTLKHAKIKTLAALLGMFWALEGLGCAAQCLNYCTNFKDWLLTWHEGLIHTSMHAQDKTHLMTIHYMNGVYVLLWHIGSKVMSPMNICKFI